jgi:hypothetical protein
VPWVIIVRSASKPWRWWNDSAADAHHRPRVWRIRAAAERRLVHDRRVVDRPIAPMSARSGSGS